MKHQLAWITGASSGIGECLAHRLAREGIPLFLLGRDAHRLHSVAQSVESLVPVEQLSLDLALPGQRKELVELLREKKPDLIVNNAGYGLYGDALSHETEKALEMVEVNVQALLQLTLEGARVLAAEGRGGTILNVSSVAGFQAFPRSAVYAATKAFVNSLSESLDDEMREHGIRVLAACPGVVATRFSSRAAGKGERVDSSLKLSMSGEFAAQEIWEQICRCRQTHVFDWRYRWMVRLSKYLLPKSVVRKTLRDRISERIQRSDWLPPPN